jgi:peptidoglycan/LPS O-acetylase OafA/YrhL
MRPGGQVGSTRGRRHFDLPVAGRAPAAPQWDEDLADPSELSNWQPSQPPPAPTLRGPAPPPRAPGRDVRRPGGSSTQVLDRGRHDEPPAPPPLYQGVPEPGYDDFPEGVESDEEPRRAPARHTKPGPQPQLPYVAGFDGLRAVALLAVLAFHSGLEIARGGFLGISSFFTLSGFLLGATVLAEWAQDGRLGVPRLWERRARRILPLFVFTVGLVVALQVTLRVGAGPGFRGDVLAALGQVLNWRFAFTGDGFASVLTDPSPVQHLWPLAILVQLIVIVPLLFVGVMRVTRKRWQGAGLLFTVAAGVSFYLASRTARESGNDGLAYYSTYTRAGELLVGVVLAYLVLSPRLRRLIDSRQGVAAVRFGAPLALVGLVGLWHTTSLYSTNLFGGVTVANALLTAWVLLAVTTPGPATDVLGSLPLRTLGKISFAAYLLHWPIFLAIDDKRLDLPGPALFAVRLAVTLAAAAVVTYTLEQPLRRIRLPRFQLVVGLGLSIAVVAAAALVLPEQPPSGVSLAIDDGSGAGDLDVVVPSGDESLSVALVGGSLASSMTSGFETWNEDNPGDQVRVHTHVTADCPLGGAGPVHLAGATVGEDTDCTGFAPRLPHLLDAADADVVVVVPSVADLGEREIDREWRHLGDPAYDAWLEERLADLDDTLRSHSSRVIWATSPHFRLAPRDGDSDWTQVDANDPVRVDRLNELIHQVVEENGGTVIDLDAWAHRLPRGGEFGPDHRADGADLTETGADAVAAWMVPKLADAPDR